MNVPLVTEFKPQHADLQIKINKPATEALAEIEELNRADNRAEATKTKIRPWLWGLGLGGIFGGMILIVPLVLLIPFFFLLYKYMRANARDLEDRRLEVPLKLLRSLVSELSPKANVVLDMDFRGYTKGTKETANGATMYNQQWMRMGLVLSNGSALQISARTLCKRKSKRKRKYTKHKDKLREELALEIRPAKGTAFSEAQTQRVAQVLKAPLEQAELRRCRVRPKTAEITFVTGVAVYVQPGAGAVNGEALLDAEKVMALTTLGYRAVNSSIPTAA